jgi:hypothetical protein
VRAALAALALLAGALASCNYHSGLSAPRDARSVGVDIFDNTSPVRDIEAEIAQRIARVLTDRVDVRIAPPHEADLVIRGTVVNIRRRGGVRSPENELVESAIFIQLDATLEVRETGEILARTSPSIWSGYIVERDRDEEIAFARALVSLTERIVLDLFRPTDPDRGESPEDLPVEVHPFGSDDRGFSERYESEEG